MRRIRDAQTIIGMLEGGEVAASLGTEITETLAKLKELSGDRPKSKVKGSVTLKLNLEVEAGAATITCDIDSKRPKPVRGSSSRRWTPHRSACSAARSTCTCRGTARGTRS